MTAQAPAYIPKSSGWRRSLLSLFWLGPLFYICYRVGRLNCIAEHFKEYLIWYSALCLASLVFFILLPKGGSRFRLYPWVLLAALGCRVLFAPLLESDDVNRYLWEGKMVRLGINPYTVAPDDPILEPHRDRFWGGINHKDQTACYPPGSLYLFSALGRVHYSMLSVKFTVILFDMGAVLLLMFLLHRKKRDLRWALVYAVNPLVLLSFSGQAHLDSIMVFFMVAGALAFEGSLWRTMFLMLALAVQSKYMALLLVPFLLNRENWKHAWIFVPASGLPFIPFIRDGAGDIFRSLVTFSTEMGYNGSIHFVLQLLTGDILRASVLCFLLFMFFYIALVCKRRSDRLYLAGLSYAALLLFSPTVHIWYLSWLIPFLCLYPAWSWIILCWTMGLYFIADVTQLKTGIWTQPLIFQVLQWGPMYLFLVYEIKQSLLRWRTKPPERVPDKASIVVPVLNAGSLLDTCLRQIFKH